MTKRITLSILFLFALLAFASCEKASVNSLEIKSPETTNITGQGSTITLEVTSNGEWNIRSFADWCWPSVNKGTGNATITIQVEGNLTSVARSTTLQITSQGASKEIVVTQKAGDGSEFEYKMPVVFHILYQDANDNKQNVTKGHMAKLLALANAKYKNNSADMNLEFIAATVDPQGKTMEEPGVERVRWDGDYPLDPRVVMSNGTTYKSLLWDPNKYINVLVYPFSDDARNILGIGHLPFTPQAYFLEGTSSAPVSYITLNDLGYAHCVSINSNFIYELSTETTHNLNDISVTIAHELGHHLGLFHTFTEDDKGTVDDCFDSDYCKDTPSYNRIKYEKWLDEYMDVTEKPNFTVVTKRTACDGTVFEARNIMDYYICYNDRFTADQRARVRHVLKYGLMLPGPKIRDTKLGVNTKGAPLDLPVRYME